MWSPILFLSCVAPPLTSLPSTSATSSTSSPPSNLVIVLLDDAGIDLFADWGSPDPAPTPTLDALAATGVRFQQAYASPVCSPARAALLTGRYGRRTGVGGVIGSADAPFALPLDEVTLPELLRDAPDPWTTAFVGKWHLTTLDWPDADLQPGLQGFDHHRGSIGNLGNPRRGYDYFRWRKQSDGVVGVSEVYATTDTIDDAIDLIRTMPEPWLLVLFPHAPHQPAHVPPAHLLSAPPPHDPRPRDLVKVMLEAFDTELARLLAELDLDRTTVVVTSDNGTHPEALPRPDPDRGKGTLGELGVRVPLVVAGASVPTPGDSDALVHLVDLFPTVAELTGASSPPSIPLDGHSLVPWLSDPVAGHGATARSVLYNERFQPNGPPPYAQYDWRSLRDGPWLYVERRSGISLFDLRDGPYGQDLLADGVDGDEEPLIRTLADRVGEIGRALAYDH